MLHVIIIKKVMIYVSVRMYPSLEVYLIWLFSIILVSPTRSMIWHNALFLVLLWVYLEVFMLLVDYFSLWMDWLDFTFKDLSHYWNFCHCFGPFFSPSPPLTIESWRDQLYVDVHALHYFEIMHLKKDFSTWINSVCYKYITGLLYRGQ